MKSRSALPIILCSFTLTTLSSTAHCSMGDANSSTCPSCISSPSAFDSFVVSGTVSLALLCGGIAGIILAKLNFKHKNGDLFFKDSFKDSIKDKSVPRPRNYSLIKKQAALAEPSITRIGHDKISYS